MRQTNKETDWLTPSWSAWSPLNSLHMRHGGGA